MDDFVMPLMLPLDVQSLAMSLVNIESPLGDEGSIASSIENALLTLPHLSVERIGTTVVARSAGDLASHVLVTARIDAPTSEEPPLAFVEMGKLFGAGASLAKGSAAVVLKAVARPGLTRDVTLVFHSGELDALADDVRAAISARPAELAVVASPTRAVVTGPDVEHPLAQALAAAATDAVPAVAAEPAAALFAALGIPSIALGPGDPAVAGTDAEFVPTAELGECEHMLRVWLTA